MAEQTAFVLGGGGHLGGYEVGMLRALLETGITPDLIIGTSIGSVQGAMLAADPTLASVRAMSDMWAEWVAHKIMKTSLSRGLATMAARHTHFASNDALRALLTEFLGASTRIEDLRVPFQCAAASIERAAARYFGEGPLIPAVLASCAVPGLWPMVEIDGEHYLDGGLVDSIPVDRAFDLGASRVFVLHVGRIERPLKPPSAPWEMAAVCFEISRRHGFMDAMSRVPAGVEVHVLPSGEDPLAPHHHELHHSPATELAAVRETISRGYRATRAYLGQIARTGHAGG